MSERDVIARCPRCGNGKVISMALGQLLQCDTCQTSYHAPIAADGETDPTALTDSNGIGQKAVVEEPTADARSTRQQDASPAPGGEGSGDSPNMQPTRALSRPDLTLAVGQRADAVAGSGEDEELDIRENPGMFWTSITMLAVGVILTTIGAAVFLVVQNLPSAGQSKGPNDRSRVSADSVDLHWTDASKFSQKMGSIMLKVERVVYGALRARDLTNEVITTEDDNLLGITISVRNRGSLKCAFQNWYGHAFIAANGDENVAELMDNSGRSYSLLKFDDVTTIEGQRLSDQIGPQETVQDTVVFLIPEEIDRASIEYFQLALPGAAVGMSDFFRFQIPRPMVEGFDPKTADEPKEQISPTG